MRVQTMLEKIAAATNGQLFGWCFVGLRIFLGFAFIYLALNSTPLSLWSPQLGVGSFNPVLWMSLTKVLAIGLGLSLLLGLLVRPFVLLGLGYLLGGVILAVQSAVPSLGLLYVPFILLFGMYLAGGAGHTVGLDGLIFRNFRRPGKLGRLLFG